MTKVFDDIKKRIKELGETEGLKEKEIELLLKPKRIKKVQLKVNEEEYPAWRILFNDALGPGKGGIRFHLNVSEDEVVSLAFWMSLKTSLAELPYGGAKGGIQFNPKEKTAKEIEKISRAYIDNFYEVLGEDIDIPAPDVYTDSQIMAWMLDEFEKKTNQHEPGMITGKPLELQGCAIRATATAKGGFIIIQEMVKQLMAGKEGIKVAVQGFGNAGANLAKMLFKAGFKVIAVSDSQGGVYDQKGLDINRTKEIKKQTGSVGGEPEGGKKISNQEILELPVDILILAALENQITEENVNQVKANYIVEIANGPINYQADQQLSGKGILVIPDILANAGGVICSYFEWAQNKAGNILARDYLEKLLAEKMQRSWQKVFDLYQEKEGISLRTAAYILAIRRILTAEKLRGNL